MQSRLVWLTGAAVAAAAVVWACLAAWRGLRRLRGGYERFTARVQPFSERIAACFLACAVSHGLSSLYAAPRVLQLLLRMRVAVP